MNTDEEGQIELFNLCFIRVHPSVFISGKRRLLICFRKNHPSMQNPTAPNLRTEPAVAGRNSPPRLRPRYQILVECRDEQDQKAFHARMVTERRKCRVLTI